MAKAADKTIDVWKKKRWHKVLAPKLFNEMVIGETPALEPNMLVGRTLKINMMALTGDMKKQNIDVTFEIDRVMGETAYSHIKNFQINPSAVRRFVRRGKNRVDDSFVCVTSDNRKVRIKPFMVTLSKTTNSVLNELRKRAREYFVRTAKGMSYDDLCREIITYNLQKSLRQTVNKIYPVRICDVRVMEIYKGDAKRSDEEEPETEVKKEAEQKKPDEEKKEINDESAEIKPEKKEKQKEFKEKPKEAEKSAKKTKKQEKKEE